MALTFVAASGWAGSCFTTTARPEHGMSFRTLRGRWFEPNPGPTLRGVFERQPQSLSPVRRNFPDKSNKIAFGRSSQRARCMTDLVYPPGPFVLLDIWRPAGTCLASARPSPRGNKLAGGCDDHEIALRDFFRGGGGHCLGGRPGGRRVRAR